MRLSPAMIGPYASHKAAHTGLLYSDLDHRLSNCCPLMCRKVILIIHCLGRRGWGCAQRLSCNVIAIVRD